MTGQVWNGTPFTLRLVGGPFDGREITAQILPRNFLVPVVVDTFMTTTGLVEETYPLCEAVEYVQIGGVADDGARLYQMRKP